MSRKIVCDWCRQVWEEGYESNEGWVHMEMIRLENDIINDFCCLEHARLAIEFMQKGSPVEVAPEPVPDPSLEDYKPVSVMVDGMSVKMTEDEYWEWKQKQKQKKQDTTTPQN